MWCMDAGKRKIMLVATWGSIFCSACNMLLITFLLSNTETEKRGSKKQSERTMNTEGEVVGKKANWGVERKKLKGTQRKWEKWGKRDLVATKQRVLTPHSSHLNHIEHMVSTNLTHEQKDMSSLVLTRSLHTLVHTHAVFSGRLCAEPQRPRACEQRAFKSLPFL